jgi:hypothetical protein
MIEPHSWAIQGEDMARALAHAKERKLWPLRTVPPSQHQSMMERTTRLLSCFDEADTS